MTKRENAKWALMVAAVGLCLASLVFLTWLTTPGAPWSSH